MPMNLSVSSEQTKRESWEYFLFRAAWEISLSQAQYEKIEQRYSQLERILNASDNPLLAEAHIFVQGSMGLRTTIKPVSGAPEDLDTIDADAIIWLPHAQGASAQEVLDAIEERFNAGSRVYEKIKQLRRGVRIVYADENPGFHIDVTPARAINGNSQSRGDGKLEVPDRENGWKASTPRPYSHWLQIASAETISLEENLVVAKSERAYDSTTQDPLPQYGEYLDQDPLRATIKLLKRHRDEWAIRTQNENHRPISAVITTLATHAYLDVVQESKSKPLRPLDAILKIVQKMRDHIKQRGNEYLVCNPADDGENFAEKWNRPLDGRRYRQAFFQWHDNATASISLGLESLSADSFTKAIKENFGIGPTFISAVNREIPANYTMPGRPDGTTRNSISMGALFGDGSATANSQEDVKPVGRLG